MDTVEIKNTNTISGWLVIPGFNLVVCIGYAIYGLVTETQKYQVATSSITAVIISWLWFGFIAVVAWFFLGLRKKGPSVYIALLVVSVILAGLGLLGDNSEIKGNSESVIDFARALVFAVVWIPYFLYSKRVELTFVH